MFARLVPRPRIVKPHAPTSLLARRHISHTPQLQQNIRYTRFGNNGPEPRGWWPQFNRWDRNTKVLAGVCGAGATYYVYHLEQVEETGRWRFIDVSLEAERQIAEQSHKEVLAEFGNRLLPPSHPVTQYVARVASRIITAANLGTVKNIAGHGYQPDFDIGDQQWSGDSAIKRLRQEWEVFVVNDDKTPNAFVTPGGKIFVFTGILSACANDDGLATVLGHEVAHQVVRHSAEKMSGMKVFTALVLLLEVLGLDVGLSRLGLTLFMSLPNSRTMESEADQIGLRLMAKACYNPRESTKLWERMSTLAEGQGGGGGFLAKLSNVDFHQTHPANSKRIKNLEGWIPEALSIRAASPCSVTGNNISIGDTFDEFRDRLPEGLGFVQPIDRPRW